MQNIKKNNICSECVIDIAAPNLLSFKGVFSNVINEAEAACQNSVHNCINVK